MLTENKDYCCCYHWSHYNNLRVFVKLLYCGFHFGTKSTQDIGPRRRTADCPNRLNIWILQWYECSKVQSRMTFIVFLSLTSVVEPMYHWAVRYLLDLFTSLTWTVKCVMGEEMKPGETPMGVSGVNPGGTVASGLLPYSKYSSVTSWQIKCHVFGCCIILIRNLIIWLTPREGKMTQIARCDWQPQGARWSHLACSGLPAVSRKKNFPKSHI